jgi:glucokinase
VQPLYRLEKFLLIKGSPFNKIKNFLEGVFSRMKKNNYSVGVDIGGTNTVVGIVDKKGTCLHKSSILMSEQSSSEIFIHKLTLTINDLYQKLPVDSTLYGIGIAAPAARHLEGTIQNSANLQWGTVHIVNLLKKHFDIPIAIINDSNAAALGEMIYGIAKGIRNFIVITLGTGLGAGIVVDGKLLHGINSLAGELGHVILIPEGRICGCGRKGCAETYASATGLRRTAFELLANSTKSSKLRTLSFDSMTALQLFEFAKSGDPLAIEAFEITGNYLGRVIANAVATFDPEAVIISGGLSNAGDMLIAPTKKSFDDNVLNLHKGNVAILKSQLNNAAILGASYLVSEVVQ